MDNKTAVDVRKNWKVHLGFALLFLSVLVSFAQDMGKSQGSKVVVNRENLRSFSTGTDCKNVPYTGLPDAQAFVVAESFVRMEIWTKEGLEMPLEARTRLIDSHLYFLQGNAYTDWLPKSQPEGVCPQLRERLKDFPKELEGMLGIVQNSNSQFYPPCEPAIELTVNGNRMVQSYEFVTDCGLR